MATAAASHRPTHLGSNLGPAERWISLVIGGIGLAAAAVRQGPVALRAGVGLAGASLLARGATSFCPVKAAATGEASIGTAVAEQVRRAGRLFRSEASQIETLRDMRLAELQELYSAERQIQALLPELTAAASHTELRRLLRDYTAEIGPRLSVLHSHIGQLGADPREHPDQAMQALIAETYKMMKVGEADVRDAGLIASLQRLLHYRIAGMGTVAAYARALNETYHAGALAGFSHRDKEIDEQLTELAETIVNPSAAAEETEGGATVQ